jgi:hypothetical protein
MMIYSMSSTRHKSTWTDAEVDVDAGGFYTDYLENKPIDSNRNVIDLAQIVSAAKSLKYIPSNAIVYAGKGTLRGRLHRLNHWVNIVELIRNCAKAEAAQLDSISGIMATKIALEKLDSLLNTNQNLSKYPWDLRDSSSKMQEIIEKYIEIQNAATLYTKKTTNIDIIATELRIPRTVGKVDPKIQIMIKEIKTRYPMLQHLNYNAWRTNFPDINEYVNMVDTSWVYFELTRPTLEVDENF